MNIPNIYWIIIVLSLLLLCLGLFIYYLIIYKGKKKDKFQDAKKLPSKNFLKMIGKNIAISDNDNCKYKSGVVLASGKYKEIEKRRKILPFIKYGKSGNIISYIKNKGHILIFGSTGSGKTDNLIKPSLIFNAKSSDNPSMLVFDPKGELYNSLSAWYKDNGYNVLLLNLDSPCSSHRWNPLQFPIDLGIKFIFIQLLFNYCKENKKNIPFKLEQELIKEQKELLSLADKLFDDLSSLIISSTSGSEVSVWTSNAAEIIRISLSSVFNTTINDCIRNGDETTINNIFISSNENVDDFFYNLSKNEILLKNFDKNFKKFNIPNISDFINNTPQDAFKKFVKASGENMGSEGIFNATKDQWSSFLMNIGGGLKVFTSKELIDMISNSDFKFQDFIDKKTIIFISTPTSGNNSKILASLFVEQLYVFLEKYAKKNGGSLKNTFYFFFEELANIPKISSVSTILTLGRGYNIFAIIAVQSLPQIKTIYGDEALSIFWDNTMVKIYLYSQDKEVLTQISNLYGKRYVKTDANENIQVDLFTQEELSNIDPGKALIMISRESAIYTNLASSKSIEKFTLFNAKKFVNISKETYYKDEEKWDKKIEEEQYKQNIINTKFTNNDELDNLDDTKIKISEDINNKKIIACFIYASLLQEKDYDKFLEILRSMENDNDYLEDDFYIKFSEALFNNIEFDDEAINSKITKKITDKKIDLSTIAIKDILNNNLDLFIQEMKNNSWLNESEEEIVPNQFIKKNKLKVDFKESNQSIKLEEFIISFSMLIPLIMKKDIWSSLKKKGNNSDKKNILSKLLEGIIDKTSSKGKSKTESEEEKKQKKEKIVKALIEYILEKAKELCEVISEEIKKRKYFTLTLSKNDTSTFISSDKKKHFISFPKELLSEEIDEKDLFLVLEPQDIKRDFYFNKDKNEEAMEYSILIKKSKAYSLVDKNIEPIRTISGEDILVNDKESKFTKKDLLSVRNKEKFEPERKLIKKISEAYSQQQK